MKPDLFISNTKNFLSPLNVTRVLVALSGGSDSVALLNVLVSVLGEDNVKAFHVNHGIRGEEADKDEEFCKALCKSLGVGFNSVHLDIPQLSKKEGCGLEECARLYRYSELEKEAERCGFDTVATAHNANDNAESIIFNLCRGSGLNGMCGIPKIRYSGKIRIVRPILWAKKEDILAYLNSISANYVTDSTNACTDYTRNYIRAEIIPKLLCVNSGAIDNISSFCSIISEAESFISDSSKLFLRDARFPEGIRIEKDKFLSLPSAVASQVLRDSAEGLEKPVFSSAITKSINEFIKNSKSGDSINLPCGLDLYSERDSVLFCSRLSKEEYRFELSKGLNRFDKYGFCIYLINSDDKNFSRISKNIYTSVKFTILNTDMINGSLYIRSRKSEDRYTVDSISRKPKNLLNSKNIPNAYREMYPLLCDDNGILCLPGFAPKDGYDGRKSIRQTVVAYIYSGDMSFTDF